MPCRQAHYNAVLLSNTRACLFDYWQHTSLLTSSTLTSFALVRSWAGTLTASPLSPEICSLSTVNLNRVYRVQSR